MPSNTIVRPETLTVRSTWKARMRAVTPSGAYLLTNRKVGIGSRLRLRIIDGGPVTRCGSQSTGARR
jgi:hypothetical protein